LHAATVTTAEAAEVQPVVLLVKLNVTVPADTAVTTPPFVTVATAGALLVQVPPLVGDKVVVDPMQILEDPVMVATGKAFTVTGEVGAEVHPVAVRVKVNDAVPAETPVTTPALVTVATAGLLLDQVPPLAGDRVVVAPTQMLLAPVILTIGVAFTVTGEVAAEEHPVTEFVKVNVAVPADTPVTTPALVTVATAALLLDQVPPLLGDKVVVAATQILLTPVILPTGAAFTVTVEVARETQPVVVFVNVNVTDPAETPVTNPAFVTVATAGLLLAQVPPVVGDKVVVLPIQMLLDPVIKTTGMGWTVTAEVAADTQPVVVLVNVKVADPAVRPVTKPAPVTEATAGLLLTQVPPVVGETVVVAPTQILAAPVILTTGNGFTVTVGVVADTQPVTELVNVKLTVPADTPVTTPALVTVAIPALLLVQVPPVVGDKLVVAPTQILVPPVMLTIGKGFTVTGNVAADTQPVAVFVKVKVAVPPETPVTTPPLVTEATPGALLTQVPPLAGDKVVVIPTQIVLPPVMLTVGVGFTVTAVVGIETHPEASVNVNVAVPAETAVTTPAFVTVATEALLLAQVPPVDGDKPVVAPIQILLGPVTLTIGVEVTVTVPVATETHPVLLLVKMNVDVPAETAVTTPAFVTVATPGFVLTQVPPEAGDKVVVAPTQILLAPVILTAGMA